MTAKIIAALILAGPVWIWRVILDAGERFDKRDRDAGLK